jgi:hypothetical protein
MLLTPNEKAKAKREREREREKAKRERARAREKAKLQRQKERAKEKAKAQLQRSKEREKAQVQKAKVNAKEKVQASKVKAKERVKAQSLRQKIKVKAQAAKVKEKAKAKAKVQKAKERAKEKAHAKKLKQRSPGYVERLKKFFAKNPDATLTEARRGKLSTEAEDKGLVNPEEGEGASDLEWTIWSQKRKEGNIRMRESLGEITVTQANSAIKILREMQKETTLMFEKYPANTPEYDDCQDKLKALYKKLKALGFVNNTGDIVHGAVGYH